jgi:hypothetical protein
MSETPIKKRKDVSSKMREEQKKALTHALKLNTNVAYFDLERQADAKGKLPKELAFLAMTIAPSVNPVAVCEITDHRELAILKDNHKIITKAMEGQNKLNHWTLTSAELSEYNLFELGLFMSCANTKLLHIDNGHVIADCPVCDFKCGRAGSPFKHIRPLKTYIDQVNELKKNVEELDKKIKEQK